MATMPQIPKIVVEPVTPETLGGWNMLLYGPFGAGKTDFATSASTHPILGECLVVDIDGGLKTVVHRKGIRRVRCNSSREVNGVLELLLKDDEAVRGINTVVIDSASAWMMRELNAISEREARENQKRAGQIDLTWQSDYKEMTGRIRRLTDFFRSLGKTVILTAVERDYGPTEQNPNIPLERRAELTPQLYNAVGQMVDFIWRISQKNGVVSLLTQEMSFPNGAHIRAKTRNERFANKLLSLSERDEQGNPTGVIKIGEVGADRSSFYHLGDFYDMYLDAVKSE